MTQEEIKALLDYNPQTGMFFWKPRTQALFPNKRICSMWNTRYAGKPAGYKGKDGYIRVDIFGKSHLAHRLAWLITHGAMPSQQIDHIDGNRANNRVDNLRTATNAENTQNRKLNANNSSGFRGVIWREDCRKWHAYICVAGKQMYLGIYGTLIDAIAARLGAEREYHPFSMRV